MLRVSLAQNYEDIYLSRVFVDDPGFYIDVGAWHPRVDSVTASFYERGWRGINIEPQRHYHEALNRCRSRDVNLQAVISNKPGRATFFQIAHVRGGWCTQMSTADRVTADRCRRLGFHVEETDVEVRTLADVCGEYCADGEVSFLKIDVEGHEREVLEGADFDRWRARVILIEALDPATQTPSQGQWEHLLLDRGYVFASFDGLNRYYVRRDEDPSVIEKLRLPRCVLDGPVVPGWIVRMVANVAKVCSADPQADESASLHSDMVELWHRAAQNEAALPALLADRYRHLVPSLFKGTKLADVPARRAPGGLSRRAPESIALLETQRKTS